MEYKFIPSLGDCTFDCICKRYGSLLKLVKKMQEYDKIDIKVIFFENNDVITNSKNDAADDLGGWNSDWFTQNNG